MAKFPAVPGIYRDPPLRQSDILDGEIVTTRHPVIGEIAAAIAELLKRTENLASVVASLASVLDAAGMLTEHPQDARRPGLEDGWESEPPGARTEPEFFPIPDEPPFELDPDADSTPHPTMDETPDLTEADGPLYMEA